MKVKTVIDYLHTIAPNTYQEPYDNSGLLVGSYDDTVTGALVSLDVTEAVIEEAISLGCNLIISHHPIIFSGIKRLTGRNYVERCIKAAIKHDINLFAIHTNLDNVYENGVNTNIAKRLNLRDVQILRPKAELGDNGVGSGIIGSIDPMEEEAFLHLVKEKMEVNCIKHTKLLSKKVNKIAVCGGSGRFLLDDAIIIADIGHYESEQFTTHMLWEILTRKFTTFAAHYTKVDTNPVTYLM